MKSNALAFLENKSLISRFNKQYQRSFRDAYNDSGPEVSEIDRLVLVRDKDLKERCIDQVASVECNQKEMAVVQRLRDLKLTIISKIVRKIESGPSV